MSEQVRSIAWEAYEHHHTEKGSDWFWVLGIITLAVTITSILLGNLLFGILIFIAGLVTALHAKREPKVIPFAITQRGLRIDDKLYPYSTLESFFIDDEHPHGPQLLAQSEKLFMPLLMMPIPEEYADEIEDILASRLPEEHLEEPVATKILEFFGF
ncbi:MAG: hypothetical protein ACI92I_000959 [Acidimicrobiales bacterium]|jgi:hypothetical protein